MTDESRPDPLMDQARVAQKSTNPQIAELGRQLESVLDTARREFRSHDITSEHLEGEWRKIRTAERTMEALDRWADEYLPDGRSAAARALRKIIHYPFRVDDRGHIDYPWKEPE